MVVDCLSDQVLISENPKCVGGGGAQVGFGRGREEAQRFLDEAMRLAEARLMCDTRFAEACLPKV